MHTAAFLVFVERRAQRYSTGGRGDVRLRALAGLENRLAAVPVPFMEEGASGGRARRQTL
jgi:hypothetical protein